jgi:DNA-binding NarL/FixJ family response regulator
MELNTHTTAALVSALCSAREHGSADAALRAAGIELPESERIDGLSDELGDLLGRSGADEPVSEALALGFLAGRVAYRPRSRRLNDPTSFVMDRDLVVRDAEGQSILRLPWFEEELFVGRQLPDISEMPAPIRMLCVKSYSAALDGERGQFAFTSYGHAYSVDAIPVHGEDGGIEAVLAVAMPGRSHASAATAYERTAERLERSATQAEQRAELHRLAGRADAETVALEAARKARAGAERARANARGLRVRDAGHCDPPSVTPRETDVLRLASHGLTYTEMAEELSVSVGTIRTHMEHIYPKLGVSDKAAAVATALRHGLIE